MSEGAKLGMADGAKLSVGLADGPADNVGAAEGAELGCLEGLEDGDTLGSRDTEGDELGSVETVGIKLTEGALEGIDDGRALGATEADGDALGAQVLIMSLHPLSSLSMSCRVLMRFFPLTRGGGLLFPLVTAATATYLPSSPMERTATDRSEARMNVSIGI